MAQSMTGRARLCAHLAGEPVDHLPAMPITMMFAAAHAGVAYREYCTDYQRLVEAQVSVAEAFGFDHVSCISDPAREAADLGAPIAWFDDQPPALIDGDALLADRRRLADLRVPDPATSERMSDRLAAARLLRDTAGDRFLVEGWVEGPCAEAADLRGLSALMLDFVDEPDFARDLLGFATDLAIRFALAQVEAGVDIVGIGDAAASLVGPRIYAEQVWPQERRLIAAIRSAGARTRLHVCGNTRRLMADMGRLGADIVDVDYPVPMVQARAAAGPDQVLLGNLAPVEVLLNGTPATIAAELAACHAAAGRRYVVGAGCEIPRGTPDTNVRALMGYARSRLP